MVIFVDHDTQPLTLSDTLHLHANSGDSGDRTSISVDNNDVPEDSGQGVLSAALNCYPIIKKIAHYLDRNTLLALSQTCRQVHAIILPLRPLLSKYTLRCENEYIEALSDLLSSRAAIPDSVKLVARLLNQRTAAESEGRLTRGRVGKCARDMVGECRRCSRIVCRNCTVKPPAASFLKDRIRRLCETCRAAELSHLVSYSYPLLPSGSPRPAAVASLRAPCTCHEAVWLCYPCGYTLRGADAAYRHLWTAYDERKILGGERCADIRCARGSDCLGTLATEAGTDGNDDSELGQPTPFQEHITRGKTKLTLTGSLVAVHAEERMVEKYLKREEEGRWRSWCGWCWRIIPAVDEKVTGSWAF